MTDIYVQIMPIIKSNALNKILLCKWIEGDYKDRFTGLIRAVDFKVNFQFIFLDADKFPFC